MYIIIKFILAIAVIICSTKIGILISKKYVYRLEELNEFKNCFQIIENKIKYTYEPLEEIFKQISNIAQYNIGDFFFNISKNIKENGAEKAWNDEVDNSELFLKKEDKDVLKEFSVLLGKTNKEGQLNQIKFINTLVERQISRAVSEREKNENIYKKLGIILGTVLVIVLI